MSDVFDPWSDIGTVSSKPEDTTFDPWGDVGAVSSKPIEQEFDPWGDVGIVSSQDVAAQAQESLTTWQAIKRGLKDGVNPFDPIDETDKQAIKENPKAYMAGNIAGSGASMLAIEGALHLVGNLIPGAGTTAAVATTASRVKKGADIAKLLKAAQPIARSAAAVGIYSTAEATSGRYEEDDAAKQIAGNVAIDVGANLLFRGAGKAVRSIKEAKQLKAGDDIIKIFNKEIKEQTENEVTKRLINTTAQEVGETAVDTTPKIVPLKTVDETVGKIIEGIPVDEPLPKYVGSINIERIDAPDDVKRFLVATLRENQDVIDVVKAGKAHTLKDIEALASDVKVDINKLKRNLGKGLYTPEELTAYRSALNKRTNEILDLNKLILTPDGDNLTNKAKLSQLLSEQTVLSHVVDEGANNAGRALSAHRIFSKNLQEALIERDVKSIEKVLGRLNNGIDINDFILKLDALPDDQSRLNFVRGLYKPKWGEVVQSYWTNSILSNTTTHIVNNISNASIALLRPIESEISGGLATVASKLTGKTQQRFLGEGAIQFGAMAGGFQKGIRKAAYVLKNGYSAADATKIDMPRLSAFKGKAQIFEAPGRMLVAADELMRTINFDMAMRQYAFNQGKKQGLKGVDLKNFIGEFINNPSKGGLKYARDEAAYRLFQKEPDKITKQLTHWTNIELGDTGLRPGRFIVPFINTPSNIIKFGVERTPLGLLKLGKTAGKELDDTAAQVLTGSVLMTGAAMLAEQGLITGRGPKDKQARDILEATGWRPYSIRIGDTYMSYRRLEPYNFLFNAATTIKDTISNEDDPRDVVEKTGNVMYSIGRSFMDASYLAGINNVLNAIEDPERYGNRFLNNFTSGFVPFSGFNRGLVRVTDPRYLNPQNVGQAIKGNIPGLSHSVPARVNTLAQIRAADNQGLSAMFNPYQVSPLLVTEDELQSKIKMALKIDNARLLGKKINKKTGKEVDAVLGDYKRYQQQQLQKVDKLERLQNRR
jgi:hypothetical protein